MPALRSERRLAEHYSRQIFVDGNALKAQPEGRSAQLYRGLVIPMVSPSPKRETLLFFVMAVAQTVSVHAAFMSECVLDRRLP
jgi:hypothetical protein